MDALKNSEVFASSSLTPGESGSRFFYGNQLLLLRIGLSAYATQAEVRQRST
jgi:hypothetical protein